MICLSIFKTYDAYIRQHFSADNPTLAEMINNDTNLIKNNIIISLGYKIMPYSHYLIAAGNKKTRFD